MTTAMQNGVAARRTKAPPAADDRRWTEVLDRDPQADGKFFYAVRTTGVYCRPTCPGRPKRENVVFYDSCDEAEQAGFRACRRCHPRRTLPAGPQAADAEGNGIAPRSQNHRGAPRAAPSMPTPFAQRVEQYDWEAIGADLDAFGCAVLGGLVTPDACARLTALFPHDEQFRSHVHMARHGFGKGEYKYFRYPLPPAIAELRTALYGRLAPIANAWNERMSIATRYPQRHADYLEQCHGAGQTRPTPLLLQYQAGDYNCLHQDLYGELAFPLQATILLSAPGSDFTGGEFVLTEQRPRMQSRAEVVPLAQGDAVVFAVHSRPVKGSKRTYRVNLRHGVSRLRSGRRYAVGIIFHDAR
jgi:uncharacterized protein